MSLRSRRDCRLASGLALFAYVTTHLGCHALGLVSLEAAEAALRATVLIWHSSVGTLLLYGAAAVHVGLALLAIYDRRTLRMPPLEMADQGKRHQHTEHDTQSLVWADASALLRPVR